MGVSSAELTQITPSRKLCQLSPESVMPYITIALLVLTLAVYVCGNPMSLALWPIPSMQFQPWQLLSYALVHGGAGHLAINLLALASFGPALERAWGHGRFLACYALAAAFGGCLQALLVERPVVGASAALFGLFAAYVISKPKARILTLFPWPLPAWFVLGVYVALSMVALAFDLLVGVAHAAHLGGVLVGMAFAYTPYNKPRV
jgi:membrane associated rhomboid family serine protease